MIAVSRTIDNLEHSKQTIIKYLIENVKLPLIKIKELLFERLLNSVYFYRKNVCIYLYTKKIWIKNKNSIFYYILKLKNFWSKNKQTKAKE